MNNNSLMDVDLIVNDTELRVVFVMDGNEVEIKEVWNEHGWEVSHRVDDILKDTLKTMIKEYLEDDEKWT